MNKLLIMLLLFTGCNKIIEGCMYADACNFNPDANTSDGSCWYASEECSCDS